MHIFKASIFIMLMLGSLIFVTYYLLSWSIFNIVILFLIGAVFVGGSIWGYTRMYNEED